MAKEQTTILSVCCALIVGGLVLGFGGSILRETQEPIGPERYEYVWTWCLIEIITTGIGAISIICKFIVGGEEVSPMIKRTVDVVNLIIALVTFGTFIWGCVIYNHVTGSASLTEIYKQYEKLWTLFMVLFWFRVAVVALVGALLLVVICLSCCGAVLGADSPAISVSEQLTSRV